VKRLEGRRALVTGATGGLGQAIARALHGRGATVIATGRREQALDELRAALGDRVETVLADLAASDGVDRLVDAAGRVDVLVANAGLPASGRLETYGEDELRRAIEVNLRSPMELARRLTPAMVERGEGHQVFLSSLSGKVGTGAASVYAATKFGVRGFAMSLRDELHGSGVGVSCVFPGFIAEAGMWAEAGQELPPGIGTRTPDDVARGVLRAIERDRAEVDVAPLSLRATAWAASVAPAPVQAIGRRLGSDRRADSLADAQRDKR
jgi:short-subunit dehydrogenase